MVVEWRYADGDYKRLTGFAIELVGMNLPVIVTYGSAAARVLQGTTKTIPIVVAAAVDLVGSGIVASLARPRGNITGLSVIDVDISGKQLELLKAFLPTLPRVAVLLNPGNAANPAVFKHLQASAPQMGVEVIAVNAATPQAIENAFAEAAQQRASAVIVAADAFFSGQGPQIAAAALRHRLATISIYQDHVLAGCLLNYGQNVADFHQRAARYVDRILKGAKPDDLPVEQPTKFDLVGTRICVSAILAAKVKDFRGRPVGDLMLRGRSEALRAFEPLRAEQYDDASTKSYLEAFAKLEAGDPGAIAAFAAHVGKRADDQLASFHLKRLLNGASGTRIVMD